VASWPGLLDVYLKHLKSGGLGAAKRSGGGDVVAVRMLRRVIAAADDEERCGAVRLVGYAGSSGIG
jgi:hypothetical protein